MNQTIQPIDSNAVLSVLGTNGERWTQGEYAKENGDVKHCLHGAIRECTPIKGDAYLIEQVANRLGWGTHFNDISGWDAVRARVVAGLVVTDADLAATFGPQWRDVVALVRRAATLTSEEGVAIAAAWAATRAATRDAAWAAALDAARVSAWAAAAAAAGAAWAAALDAAGAAARVSAWAAARALVARDLIGKYGFTQEHYDTLTAPWRSVIGKVHPDDAEAAK